MANRKIVLLVIDGLGVGPMADALIKGNTWKTLLKYGDQKELPLLHSLIQRSKPLALDYQGADSFLGHLTLSGVDVNKIQLLPLSFFKNKIVNALQKANYQVHEYQKLLIVNDAVIISDNFEAEHGLAINLTGCRDLISQEEQTKIAQIVRKIVSSTRVISFGAKKTSLKNYYQHILHSGDFIGLDTPKTGVYNETFDVIHLPKKINYDNTFQVKFIKEKNYQVYMYGKFANIINLKNLAINYPIIQTQAIFDQLIKDLTVTATNSLFCVNIQETDLAGHSSDVAKYWNVLTIIEQNLQTLTQKFPDLELIITSDHGNDPAITNGQHTREMVPFTYQGKFKYKHKIVKLSDIASFMCNIV